VNSTVVPARVKTETSATEIEIGRLTSAATLTSRGSSPAAMAPGTTMTARIASGAT
jgi:hypothetical protein